MKKNIKGFTLIEMVITIVIIVVLSSISVPLYKDYVRDAKLSEGRVLLSRIRDAQLRYYDEYGNFLLSGYEANFTANNDVLRIDARMNKYFTSFGCGDQRGYNNSSKGFCAIAKSSEWGYMYILYTTTGFRQEGRVGAYWHIGDSWTSGEIY